MLSSTTITCLKSDYSQAISAVDFADLEHVVDADCYLVGFAGFVGADCRLVGFAGFVDADYRLVGFVDFAGSAYHFAVVADDVVRLVDFAVVGSDLGFVVAADSDFADSGCVDFDSVDLNFHFGFVNYSFYFSMNDQ